MHTSNESNVLRVSATIGIFFKYCRVKSEREKHISYINAYMWNLEKW